MKRYYACPLTGSGIYSDPFRPRVSGYGANWAMIDLRGDPKKAIGMAIACLDSPAVPKDSRLTLLTDDIGVKSIALRKILNSKLGLSLTRDTLPGILAELLIAPQRPGFCPPLRPMTDGQYRILLDGQIYGPPLPTYGHGSSTESFNKPDDGLGPDLAWIVVYGGWHVVSNRARTQVGATASLAYANVVDPATANHYVQSNCWSHGNGVAVAARIEAGHLYDCYIWGGNTPGGGWEINKIIDSVITLIGSNYIGYTSPVGELFRLEVNGNALLGKVGGITKVSIIDSSLAGYTKCGIWGWGSVITPEHDAWEAGDLGAPVNWADYLLDDFILTQNEPPIS